MGGSITGAGRFCPDSPLVAASQAELTDHFLTPLPLNENFRRATLESLLF
jgi:uncharacterized protein (DUF1499 family)